MKVVFLFMSQGCASPGSTERTYPKHQCGTKYMDDFAGEGYFKLLDALVKNETITDLKIFFESNVQPGLASWVTGENVYCEVIPEIRFVEEYIDKDTIIFARGGFKHWHDFLLKYKGKNWLMLYAANTGRQRWTFWDIILDDLRDFHSIDKYGRYYFPFVKPINEDMFYPKNDTPIEWDFCIGASHIHDRKGQWRALEAIIEYNRKYGEIRAVMPGAPRRSIKTHEMLLRLDEMRWVETPGHVHRTQLREILNGSKYFIHLGAHGQNDRGPLEALACGTSTIIASPGYHAPFLTDCCFTGCNLDDKESIANSMHFLRNAWTPQDKIKTYNFYKKKSGFEGVVIPKMTSLFSLLSMAHPCLQAKKEIRQIFLER